MIQTALIRSTNSHLNVPRLTLMERYKISNEYVLLLKNNVHVKRQKPSNTEVARKSPLLARINGEVT